VGETWKGIDANKLRAWMRDRPNALFSDAILALFACFAICSCVYVCVYVCECVCECVCVCVYVCV